MTSKALAVPHKGSLMALLNEAPDDLADSLQSELGVGGSGSYLKYSGKSGYYTFDGKPLDQGTILAFNFFETQKGFVAYAEDGVKGRVSEKVFGGKALPDEEGLMEIYPGPFNEDEGEGWKATMSFPVRFLDTGKEAVLSFSSGGGVRAAQALFKDWYGKAKMEVDDEGEPMVCLVEIDSEEKKRKGSGSYFIPKLKIVNFISAADLAAELGLTAPAEEEAPKPAPKAPKAVAAAKKPTIPGRAGFGSGVRGART